MSAGPASFLNLVQENSRNFFLFIRTLSGIRHDPGGSLSVRLTINSTQPAAFAQRFERGWLLLFWDGSAHPRGRISFRHLDLLCLVKPRVFVLVKQLRQRMHRSQSNAQSGQPINFATNHIATVAVINRSMIAATIVPEQSPMRLERRV